MHPCRRLLPARGSRAWLVALLAVVGLAAACARPSSPRPIAVEKPTTTTAPPTTEPPSTAPPTTKATTTTTAPPATTEPPSTAPPATPPPTLSAVSTHDALGGVAPYVGLGAWVDVYDWSHYRDSTASFGPADVDRMAAEGVQTLFIQTTKQDAPGPILEPDLLLPILDRAHERGLRVVGWYLPTLEDPQNDLDRLLATAKLNVDGIAVDIEARNVGDVGERNARLVQLSSDLRAALPGRTIGGIVLPPVVTEVVNPNYWPDFPWRDIAPYYDVWQIMDYWSNRTQASGYKDAFRYTDENIRRLRNDLGIPKAAVHPVGGLAEATSADDLDGFLRAAVKNGCIGGSIYDYRTTADELWEPLRKFRG
ncbi:MAG TPA: hypothetical protein VHN98_06615 [Acidimicrobiales bacterium]|nr:hypothetical protein [Acidimicrobiales bacterium]